MQKTTNVHELAMNFQQVLGNGAWDGVDRTKKIHTFPEQLRHSCLQTGVVMLPLQTSDEVLKVEMDNFGNTYPKEYGRVPYFYCQACGKLYMPANFMDIERWG